MNKEVQKSLRITIVRWSKTVLLCFFMMQDLYSVSLYKKNDVSDAEITRLVTQELEKQFVQQKKDDREIADYEHSVRHQLEKVSRPKYTGRHYQDYYTLPNWPFYSNFFYNKRRIEFTGSFECASQAYSSKGSRENLSKLAFGEQPITIQEILLVSKLVALNKLVLPPVDPATATACPNLAGPTPGAAICFGAMPGLISLTSAGYFLGALAPQQLAFKASEQTYQTAVNYSRNFFKGDMEVGLYLPVIAKSHQLKLDTRNIDSAIQSNIDCVENANPGNIAVSFSEQYGTLSNFFDAILAAKGIAFNHKNTQVALGDLSTYANFTIHSERFTRLMTGAILVFPTGKRRNASQLWPVDFGNGGFFELGVFGSALWGHGKTWNPYIHTKLSGSFCAHLSRRVPQIITYAPTNQPSGVSPASQNINLLLGSGVGLLSAADGGAFSLPDSTIRGFADSVQRIKIRRGPEFLLQVGNSFGQLPSKYGHFDVSYKLLLKGRDHVSGSSNSTPGIWTANTFMASHTVDVRYDYQWNENCRFGVGASYVFAGRNTPITFGLDLGVSVDF